MEVWAILIGLSAQSSVICSVVAGRIMDFEDILLLRKTNDPVPVDLPILVFSSQMGQSILLN